MLVDPSVERYWTTDDTATLDALADARAEHDAWMARVDRFRREYGTWPRMDGWECVGVTDATDRLPGRWTRTAPFRPLKSNVEGMALLAGLSRVEVEVPGAQGLEDVRVYDGAAFARTRDPSAEPGVNWRPCEAWQWMRAVERGR